MAGFLEMLDQVVRAEPLPALGAKRHGIFFAAATTRRQLYYLLLFFHDFLRENCYQVERITNTTVLDKPVNIKAGSFRTGQSIHPGET